ncbi:MAG: sel1 repeat family protein [Alphaproteobacteria bacterium]|nr:sel1 repeat family protein [Alphaproteobacteria bacterium]
MNSILLHAFPKIIDLTNLSNADSTVKRAIEIVEHIESLHFQGRVPPAYEVQRAQNAADCLTAFIYQNPSLQSSLKSGQKLSPLEADAHGAMALCALRGIGRMQGSLQTVSQLANIASTHNSPAGHYATGLLNMELFNPPRYEEARGFFEQAAETGHAGAQYMLAVLHANSLLSKSSNITACGYLEQAAAQGHPKALCDLGGIYTRGLSVPGVKIEADPLKAIGYYKASYQKGFEPAVNHLGQCAGMYAPNYIRTPNGQVERRFERH